MPDTPTFRTPEKATLAVLKGGPEFQAWFRRLQTQTRLPGALILDAALVEFARTKGFDEPPPALTHRRDSFHKDTPMSSNNPRNQAISDLDSSVLDIFLYWSIDILDRDGVITKANDRMLRDLPRDHPILASLEAWELAGLFTLDDDPHHSFSEATKWNIDIEDDEAVDSLTKEEFLALSRDVFLDTKLMIMRAAERGRVPGQARLDSTISYLSQFDHPGVRKFLLSFDRLAHELGAIPELTRNSVGADEAWKNGDLVGGAAGLKKIVESSFAFSSATVAECFGETTLSRNLHENSGSLRAVDSGPESPLLDVVRGLSEGFESARSCLIWYIDEKYKCNSRQSDDKDSATDD